jgi:iron(III) transport system ATP-binding protein
MAELRIDGLSKAFGNVPILRGLSLVVAPSRLLAVLGASGSGKTTLLRLICGFDRADAGTVAIGGRCVCGPALHLRPEQRQVGYVAQDGALFPHLSVADNITFGLPWRQRHARYRVGDLLDLVGLPALYAARWPHELSGGEQQRVALARALAPAPKLVLLDEPFSALDAALRVETRGAVAAALAASGATAVLVTHDQSEALSMGDEVAVLRAGAMAQIADPRTLYHQPADLALAQFLGEAIVMPGVVMGGEVQCALGVLPLVSRSADGPVEVMIRPEQIRLETPTEEDEAVVSAVTYYGHDCRVTLTAIGLPERACAMVPGHAAPRIGEHVGLRVEGSVMVYAHQMATEKPCQA